MSKKFMSTRAAIVLLQHCLMAASVVLTGRTVLVGRRSLEDAVRVLNNIMRNDGLVKKV